METRPLHMQGYTCQGMITALDVVNGRKVKKEKIRKMIRSQCRAATEQ